MVTRKHRQAEASKSRSVEDLVPIPTGTFRMGFPEYERMVVVDAFLLGRFEVTEERFMVFCAETGRSIPEGWPHDNPRYPALVAWDEAAAFCAHYGMRLPTEAEFEWALRCGEDGGVYPWGDTEARPHRWGNLADQRFLSGEPAMRESGFPDFNDGFAGWAPVGSFPPSVLGLHDLSGNAWEWCYDWFERWGEGYVQLRNPKGPSNEVQVEGLDWVENRAIPVAGGKVVRGGGWDSGRESVKCSFRWNKSPRVTGRIGFRCAADIVP